MHDSLTDCSYSDYYSCCKDGKDGKNGKNGIDGREGRDGIDGRDGRDGRDGIDGIDGCNGCTGPRGNDGDTGPQGDNGCTGHQGNDGIQGNRGPTGPQGETSRGCAYGWNAQSDDRHPFVANNNSYYYIGDGHQSKESNAHDPTSDIGIDSLTGNGFHPFFVPTTVTIKWVSSVARTQNLSDDIYNIDLYYTNPSGSLAVPVLVSSTSIDSSIQPANGVIVINGPFSSARFDAIWVIVIDTTAGDTHARNFTLGGTILFE